jgi:hypothetical protein
MKPNTCPFPHPTPLDTANLPPRIAKLPQLRGFPVPWFVDKVNGEYDFRVMDGRKLVSAVKLKLCWVCGEKLGAFKSFVIGPMCGVNRTNAEPPSHRDCAIYSATHCPFLSRPHMKRREDELTRELENNVAGFGLKRNPGVCAVWTTKNYDVFRDGRGGFLFHIGEPDSVEWYAEGRKATHYEVLQSILSGVHHLRSACDQEETQERQVAAHAQLNVALLIVQKYLPVKN